MNIKLRQAIRQHGAREVRMAMKVIVVAGEQLVDVGIAPGAEEVVAAAAVGIDAVGLAQAVTHDGHHRPQVRQRAPQPVEPRHVAGVQLPRSCRPEPLPRVVLVPQVQVADLRAFRC